MYSNKYLFIGGTVDGKWLEVPVFEINNPRVVPVFNFTKIVHFSDCVPLSLETEKHHYLPERFIAGSLTIIFFRFDEMSIEEAVTRLLKGYKP